MRLADEGITGILLAAGKGQRFDPSGARNKLLQAMPGGEAVAFAAARSLLAALPNVVAVVRSPDDELAAGLWRLGCEVIECEEAERGMSVSLVRGVLHKPDAAGWLIALADMPYVQSSTVAMLSEAIERGAEIAVPVHQGRRGNPVAFASSHFNNLIALQGDRGARTLLREHPVTEVEVDDDGINRDIDMPADLV
ncbi:MAG: nucleotidyltransferase family protein [Paucimonas sp.]|jgi:molybdenum cofactor cytidylyltransferase|nr:nucleotidyltransferase family protein [Burkholderiales bacterium]MDF3035115.1 nucleotidyltransferase family protein [Paucimonas sp.]